MKGGVAVMLRVAHELAEPSRDVTYVFYEGEEIDERFNGLLHVQEQRPDLIDDADFAVLLEPTDAVVEGGCKGTLRAVVSTKGVAAHSARPWNGHNAIHDAAEVLTRLAEYRTVTRTVDGLEFHEAINAVAGRRRHRRQRHPGPVRRSPSTTATRPRSRRRRRPTHVRELFEGFDVDVVDNAGGARPGLRPPAPRGPSSRPSACRSSPSRAGPTSPASRRWGCRR